MTIMALIYKGASRGDRVHLDCGYILINCLTISVLAMNGYEAVPITIKSFKYIKIFNLLADLFPGKLVSSCATNLKCLHLIRCLSEEERMDVCSLPL